MNVRFVAPIVCVIAALAMVRVASGQESRVSARAALSLDEATRLARERNRELIVARREVDVIRGRVLQARRYPFNPELSVEGSGGQARGREERDRRSVGGGRAGLSQVIEIRGQRGLRIQGAEADLGRAEWALRDREREVMAATTRAFADLLNAQERLALARELLDLARGLKETADRLVEAGEVAELDALRSSVELRRAANRVTQEDAAVATVARALALLVAEPPDVAIQATGPLMLPPIPGTLDELLARASADRPDLRAAEAATESARAALRLVQAERFVPTVTLSGSYGEDLEFDARARTGILALSVPLPLWNRRDGDVKAAEAEVARLEADRERLRADVAKDVATAYRQFAAATQVVEEYIQRILPGQEQAARLIREGYRQGEFRLTEALLAQRDFFDTRSAYLEAIATYNATRTDLQRATGLRP